MGSHTVIAALGTTKMFRIILTQILLIASFSYTTNATITLACFSFPFVTLPSFSLTGTSVTSSSFSFLENVGSSGSNLIDICGVGLLAYLTILILPEILPESKFKQISSRLSETSLLAEPAVPASLDQPEDVFVSGLEVRPDTNSDFLFVSPVL